MVQCITTISIYIYATVRSFGPLLDTSAIRDKNMKHSDYIKGTSLTTGDARPVYTTVYTTELIGHRDASATYVYELLKIV